MPSRVLFTVVVALVAVQRLVELSTSRRNRVRLLARGGVEHGSGHYPWMVALHAAFLVSCVAEVWLLERPFLPGLAAVALAALLAAAVLRWWTLRTLGGRWTTRVVVVPGERTVTTGPYRFLRHPNYAAVVLEILALPMLHTAWLTAAGFSLLNAWLLVVRIRCEEQALALAGPGADRDGRG